MPRSVEPSSVLEGTNPLIKHLLTGISKSVIVEMVAANHHILQRARQVCPGKLFESNPSCSLSLILRENVHRDSVRFSLTATNAHPSFAFTSHYEKKIATILNKFCIENGANDVTFVVDVTTGRAHFRHRLENRIKLSSLIIFHVCYI